MFFSRIFSITFLFGLTAFAFPVSATVPEITPSVVNMSFEGSVAAFRSYADVTLPSQYVVPTVVEVDLGSIFLERPEFAVYDVSTKEFEPYYFRKQSFSNLIPLSVSTEPAISGAPALLDRNIKTYAEFPVAGGGVVSKADILLYAESDITSSSFTLSLDENVALPTTVEVSAGDDASRMAVLVARAALNGQVVNFPRMTARYWKISFTFSQPLRITELNLEQENAQKLDTQAVRFLAQPNRSYRIYFDADRSVRLPLSESPNLASAKNVLKGIAGSTTVNPFYKIADGDGDTIPDRRDNCVSIANPDQADVNGNGTGDLCDDFDQDGVMNSQDNCPNDPNRGQDDIDLDKVGDACDGEESRVTEKYTWLPWLGIGIAALVLVLLLAFTIKNPPKPPQMPTDTPVVKPENTPPVV